MNLIKRLFQEEEGQGLTEYALIIALVSIGLVAVLILFRDEIGGVFDTIINKLADPGEYASGDGT